jgi:hypothetical protein
MRIGNDRASIALVTLDDKENANKERGRLLRAMARAHCSTATSRLEPGSEPGPRAQIHSPPAGPIDTADALTRGDMQPQATPSATTHNADDALRRALTAAHRAASRGKATGVAAPGLPPRPSSAISKQAYVPWRDHARRHMPLTDRTTQPVDQVSGPKVLLLCDPIKPPDGFVLRVRTLTGPGGAREAAARLTEAERIVPMLPEYVWQHVLGETAASLAAWPAGKLAGKQLNAIANMEGANTLAKWRCTYVHLTYFLRAEYGRGGRALDQPVGASVLQEWLEGWEEDAVALATAKAAAKGIPIEDTAGGLTAAPARLGCLRAMQRLLGLHISADASVLDPLAVAPQKREGRQAHTPELAHAIHFELGAADFSHKISALPMGGEIVRGSHAMAALLIQVCVRTALAERSGGLEDAANGMGVGRAGVDLKKHQWGQAGRPLLCHTLGFSGTSGWWHAAKGVLARDGYGNRVASLLRAHDGAEGDPFRATRWLDRPPTGHEWVATLRAISRADVHVQPSRPGIPTAHDRPWVAVTPRLVTKEAAEVITMHSLKSVMITAFAAAGVHDSYLVEPGAHAGSTMERLSLDAARQQTELVSSTISTPSGLQTARGYAHKGLAASHATNVCMVTGLARAYLAAVGTSAIPREGGWRAMAVWVQCACHGAAGALAAPPRAAVTAVRAPDALWVTAAPAQVATPLLLTE